jgi:chromosome segregation ATPase
MTISDKDRKKVLELRDDGLSLNEIAQKIGTSKGSVYNIIQEDKEKMKENDLKRREESLLNGEQELKKRKSAIITREKDLEDKDKSISKKEKMIREQGKKTEKIFSLLKENNLKMEDLEDIINNYQYYVKVVGNLKSEVFRLDADISQKKRVHALLQAQINDMSIGRDNLNNEIRNLIYQRDSIEKEKNQLINEEDKLVDYIINKTEEVVRYYNDGIQEVDKAIDQYRKKSMEEEVGQIKEEIETTQEKMVDLKAMQAELEKDIKAKKAERDALENQLMSIKTEIIKSQITAKNLQDTVNYWIKVKNAVEDELVEIGKEYHNTKRQLLFGEI